MRTPIVLLLSAGLIVAGCSGAEPDAPPVVAEDDAGDGATDDGETIVDSGEAADEPADEPADDAPAAAGGGATVTVEGTTYEATDVLECSVGDDGVPDDRAFIGTSSDGQVRIDINWFADESLAGLNAVTVEVQDAGATGGELAWSTSYAGADSMTIDQRADGADGTAQLGSLNRPDGETVAGATWSYTC